jgi:hypothetical protein
MDIRWHGDLSGLVFTLSTLPCVTHTPHEITLDTFTRHPPPSFEHSDQETSGNKTARCPEK